MYRTVLDESALRAVLNEADVVKTPLVDLPAPYRGRIMSPGVYAARKHADIRLARRASTVANVARVISERDVSSGLRRTLHTRARRLETLSRERLDDILRSGRPIPVEDAKRSEQE